MIKKTFYGVVLCTLILGLTACNNNWDTADEHGTFNVSHKEDNVVRDTNLTRSPDHDEDFNDDFDFANNPELDENNEPDLADADVNISNMKTTISSKNYPHTKAILLQEARYKFVKINPNQAGQQQKRNRHQAKAPAQKQQGSQHQPKAPAKEQQQIQQPAPAENNPNQQAAPENINQAAQKVIDLTNAERRKNGLPELKADTQLSGVAQKKSADMAQNNYFSHTSPTYGSPFDMMRDMGVAYRTAGENIAQGQTTPEKVVQSWMNSEGHRKNILSKEFTHIGVGYDSKGHHWTQMFIGK